MLFEESNTEEIAQKTEQKFCQKVKREKTEDQTRRSSILKIRALRKVHRGNEGE